MTPAESLRAWQDRLGYTQIEAAAALDTPAQTYRNWLCERAAVPRHVTLLCRYIERYGPFDVENIAN